MLTIPDWPDEDEGQRLHVALFTYHQTASNAFANAFFDPLLQFLRARFPNATEDLAVTAAGQTLMDLIERPNSYDPKRGTLPSYLRMSAKGDMLTLLRREGQQQARENSLKVVEDLAVTENAIAGADGDQPNLPPRFAEELAALTSPQQTALALMCDRVRNTNAFAAALGLDRTRPDLARAVKRIKDTIKARLRRAAGG